MGFKEQKFGSGTIRRNYQRSENDLKVFDLLKIQKDSFKTFLEQGLEEAFQDTYPVESTNGKLRVEYLSHSIDFPNEENIDSIIKEHKQKGSNYSAIVKAKFKLIDNLEGNVIQTDEAFIMELPLMNDGGSFIINGSERVIISQIVRAPGAYFENLKTARAQSASDSSIYKISSIIPNRGAWIELDYKDYKLLGQDPTDIKLRIDKSKRIKAALLLHALGLNDVTILSLFYEHELIIETLKKISKDESDPLAARKAIFKVISLGERPTTKPVNNSLSNILFNKKRYDLSKTGRFKLSQKLSPYFRLLNQTIAEDILDNKGNVILKAKTKVDINKIDLVMKAWEKNTLKLTELTIDPEVFGILKDELTDAEKILFSQVNIIKIYKNKNWKQEENPKVINIISTTKTDYVHLTISDMLATLGYFLNLEDGIVKYDDIDSLENRKIRTINDLLKNQVRTGLSRIERNMRDRLSPKDQSTVTIKSVTNHKLMESSIKEFFNSSQLSQFMDQINPLAEVSNKRRLTSLGPGGLSRDTASLVVRGIHDTHYGRIDPIETPEGPNIGLILNLAIYARVNEYGLIETPYFKVENKQILRKEILWLTSDKEEGHIIAPGNVNQKDDLITDKKLIARSLGNFIETDAKNVTLMDVSPKQTVSLATSHIPFLDHNDANRALMGANMQRQAVPLMNPEAPIVATGIEQETAKSSPTSVIAKEAGVVEFVDSTEIVVKGKTKLTYALLKFERSNQGSLINQIPIVSVGQKIKQGEVIADGPSVEKGELAIGKNVLVAFTTWRGYNYEDAIIISERLVKDDVYTSIHVEQHSIEQRDTRNGIEEITSDIPNVSKESIRNLDSHGIIVEGSEVKVGDVLVGKITPKGEDDQSPEEKLLDAILGTKAKQKRDTSLRVPHGAEGVVQKVEILKKSKGVKLNDGVEKIIKIYIAQKRKIKAGDKMSGRHGNKGVVSRVLPIEDMPHLEDGTPVDIMLNPLGVPSRMNIGQVLELHLGMAAKMLNVKVSTPIFSGATKDDIQEAMKEAGIHESGKFDLYDGISGEKYESKVAVGIMYMLKLSHMIDDKMHARSIGPYSLITQQPLRGKSQNGGQRFGEMEAWAIEAYGATNILREMVTLKSDDIKGRNELYNAIAKNKALPTPNIPEGFWVLYYELRGLGFDFRFLDENDDVVEIDNTL